MREIVLFVEDFAHRQIIGPLVERIAGEQDVAVRLDWRSAVRSHGQVAQQPVVESRVAPRAARRPPDKA